MRMALLFQFILIKDKYYLMISDHQVRSPLMEEHFQHATKNSLELAPSIDSEVHHKKTIRASRRLTLLILSCYLARLDSYFSDEMSIN